MLCYTIILLNNMIIIKIQNANIQYLEYNNKESKKTVQETPEFVLKIYIYLFILHY